ncbi:hypothetical protein MKY96_32940 [Paenibacillus sp. FSL R7-0302]|uniref:hypothetical protein n=1 Tax=Paenibacillus sp. FSL R7-0302 TaxID=2921681 RepID=UPI0030F9AFD2
MTEQKYKRGQKVVVDGYEGIFIVESFFYEYSFDEDGEWESGHYDLRSEKSGLMLEYVDHEDTSMRAIDEPKKLDKAEIDKLLDKHNQYMNLHSLLNSTGVIDSEYLDKANEIVNYLNKI